MVDGTQIALAGLTVAGTLSGVLVGNLMQQRRESKNWLRDAKLRVYTGLIRGADDIAQAVRDMGEARKPDSAKAAALRYLASLESFRMATSEAQLVGSLEVWQTLVDFNTATNAINFDWAARTKWPSPDVATASDDWEPWKTLKARALAMFDALRADIGENPIPEFDRPPIDWGTN